MEAIRSLIRGDLPPAGNAISVSAECADVSLPEFPGYFSYWVDSGTAALALALLAIKRKLPHIQQPEVIVPAYCCPDLIAAANFAGVKAVLIDISVDDPAFDLVGLSAAITDQTIAVIAVAFLGIRENLSEISRLLQNHRQISLIEDNAQWFPDQNDLQSLMGDFVVFSFGRGKPVSLLGGGLLLSKLPLDIIDSIAESKTSTSMLKFKYLAYNLLLQPQLYQIINRNPLIKLGQTRYHALEAIARLDHMRIRLLPQNIYKFRHQTKVTENAYDDCFASSPHMNCLAPLGSLRRRRLLRYPVLCRTAALRDQLMMRLNNAGLGGTTMYQKPLIKLEGISAMVCIKDEQINAHDFAQRLITLPLHEGVTGRYLMRIVQEINRYGK